MKESGVGLEPDPATVVNILLYADEILILANNGINLQFLLLFVEICCLKQRLEVN